MPPRARQLRAGTRTASGSGPGPVPSPVLPLPATPPAVQHWPSAPALLPFPPSYAPGGYPVPVGGGQYPGYIPGLGMNAPPTYAQPYAALPPYPPFHPHLNPYAGASNTQYQQWNYGHYPTGPFLNLIPNPGPLLLRFQDLLLLSFSF
ncbi:hypothetical protein EDB85DRAFT_2150112 [Lactarius pseudohatsudake]|nr:hypothetical protein EDB85DRAFT_2150112 [Lactarius pseudohatsudake]